MTPEQIADLPYRPCVGIMLANANGLIFAGQRLDTSADAWQMPQGGIDKGEQPHAAALRELEEETGISQDLVTTEAELDSWLTYDLPSELVGKVWKGRYRGQKQRWFLMRFHGSDDQINIATEHQEFSRWAWVAPDLLVAKIVPFKRDIYHKVVAEFAPHLSGPAR